MQVKANGIGIEVEDGGGSGDAVLLIMGLGMQLIAWPPEFVRGLATAGYRVVRHDNRDIGLSQHFDEAGLPSLFWSYLKLQLRLGLYPVYTLQDMALDAIGVLDALGIARAHVVGVSMGGMIAQRVALTAPERVLSLTSIMSSSGARHLPGPRGDVLRVMLTRPPAANTQTALDYYVRFFRLIGTGPLAMPESEIRSRVAAAGARSYHPQGTQRQLLAVVADTARAALLGRIRVPTLVIHGSQDPLVRPAAGMDTARRIPGARLEIVEGMAHDLTPSVVQRVLPLLLAHLRACPAPVAA